MNRMKIVCYKCMAVLLCVLMLPVPVTEAKSNITVTKKISIRYYETAKISVKGSRIKKKSFKSSNKSVATVTKKGKVKARNNGTCKITVTVKYKKKKKSKRLTKKKFICQVNVQGSPPHCGGTGISIDSLRNEEEKKILKEIIEKQQELGASVSSNLDSSQYLWQYITDSRGVKELRLCRIDWNSMNLKGEISFRGLDELYTLNCYDNQLTKIDVGENKDLTYMDVSSNELEELDVSKNEKLTFLECDYNQLRKLDVTNNPVLERLSCRRNMVTELDVSKNVALERLFCSNNELTALDISQNTLLQRLECRRNELTELDVSKNTALTNLHCEHNQIKTLDVSLNKELKNLTCDKAVFVTGYNPDKEESASPFS